MARGNSGVGVSVCVMMVMIMMVGAAAQAPAPSVDCTQVVLTLSDCLGFVTGTDKTPPKACCTELSSVVNSTPQCLCLLFNTTFTTPLGVNVTRAQQLPPLCKVQTPPTSLCASFGVPVPGPVSSASPGMPPSPAAKSPASTPASSPGMAPSSSPTPTPTPTSMASPPSPTAAPAGATTAGPPSATQPSSNSTAAPSPNSAHATNSWTAGVTVSLLLFTGILLS